MFVSILAGLGAVVLSVFLFLSAVLFLDWLSGKILGRRFDPSQSLAAYLYFLPVPLWLLLHAKITGAGYCSHGWWRLSNIVLLLKIKEPSLGTLRWWLLWLVPMWLPFLAVSFLKSLRNDVLGVSRGFVIIYSPVNGFSDEEWPEAERLRKEQDQRDKAERKARGWSCQQQLDYWYGYHACKSGDVVRDLGKNKMWHLGWEEAEQEEPDGSEK